MTEIDVSISDREYNIRHDPYTGDWALVIEDENSGGQFWYADVESAVLAALRREGIPVDEKRIERAPTRCDA